MPWFQGIGPMRAKHLVATTKLWRLPASQRPRISSVRPTVLEIAAHRVDIGRVEEVDAARRGRIEDGAAPGFIALQPEGHGPEAEPRYRKSAARRISHGP